MGQTKARTAFWVYAGDRQQTVTAAGVNRPRRTPEDAMCLSSSEGLSGFRDARMTRTSRKRAAAARSFTADGINSRF